MPTVRDHPLYLARIRAGVGQKQLADAVGMNRSSIAAIEEGRTSTPTPGAVEAIEAKLGMFPRTLQPALDAWAAKRAANGPVLTPLATAVLREAPAGLNARYASFVHWRSQIAPSPTAFASMLNVNRAVVAKYEQGIRSRGMPDTLSHALVSVLGITNDYLLALQQLPPSED